MFAGEGATIAEDIAELGEIFDHDGWKQLINQQANVFFRAARDRTKFGGNDVRAQKGGNNFKWLFSGEFALEGEDFEFAGDVEAVAAFGFNGGGAVGSEFLQGGKGSDLEGLRGSGAKFFYGIEDAAALAGDFLVAGALDFQLVFFRAAGGVIK